MDYMLILQIEGFGSLCCVLGQDTYLSHCLSPSRSKRGNCEYYCQASHSRGSSNTPIVASCNTNWS